MAMSINLPSERKSSEIPLVGHLLLKEWESPSQENLSPTFRSLDVPNGG